MSWRRRGLYVWTARRPGLRGAVVRVGMRATVPAGLVFSGFALWAGQQWWACVAALVVAHIAGGRHVAYVGMTSSRYHRDAQHADKPWSDLSPRVWALPCFLPGSRFARSVQEKAWILLLHPAYNVQWNRHNPSRISPGRARAQRATRDFIKIAKGKGQTR